jgi:hypothetical protein
MLSFTATGWAAEPTGKGKPATKKTANAAPKAAVKKPGKARATPAAKKRAKVGATRVPVHPKGMVKTSLRTSPVTAHAPVHALRGKTEVLTCRDGTEDRHARIALVLVGGKADAFAYYSKWKPRTCSIYLQRNRDPYSKWSDSGSVTNVSLERGVFLIEHRKNEYRLVFRDIDRERYCGMDGTINGTLTIRKGSQHCEIAGIMEEGVPLGQAYASLDQTAPAQLQNTPATAPSQPPAAASAGSETGHLGFFARHFRRQQQSAFPTAAPGVSD